MSVKYVLLGMDVRMWNMCISINVCAIHNSMNGGACVCECERMGGGMCACVSMTWVREVCISMGGLV